MKKIAIITLFFFCFLPLPAYGHSGRTNYEGGHYNHSDGSYHYHHGYPAHQHENGQCPYELDTASDSDTNNKEVEPISQIIMFLFLFSIFHVQAYVFLLMVIIFVFNFKHKDPPERVSILCFVVAIPITLCVLWQLY